MTVFYVDTSSNYLYTGIYRDGTMLSEKHLNLNHDLSTFAINEIDKMFKEVNVTVNDIDKIMVVSGPGSFTGIRIGMTLAKVYAFMLKKDIITITSLEAMNLVTPEINKNLDIEIKDNEVLKAGYISLDKLKLVLLATKEKYVYITNDNFKDIDTVKYEPNIKNIIEKYLDREPINPHLVEPTYFKLTEAEENLNRE